MAAFPTVNVVVLDFNDLVAGVDLSDKIRVAYGEDGLGILTVANVPGLSEARDTLLRVAHKFAKLDEVTKNKYAHRESKFSFGWSHGVENLEGKPDVSKGSYYANPQFDVPVANQSLVSKFPAFIHPNIWPTEDCPEMEPAFKALGQLIVLVGHHVAAQCDRYVKSVCESYTDSLLHDTIDQSLCCKARLLHYFPIDASQLPPDEDENFSSWCGWHNDHGTLTGLVSAMFIDSDGNVVENTDPTAGLYARSRKSELAKIAIPKDHIAFQIGECAQIHTGGLLQATPHAVRGSRVPGVSRETFAVFMEPNWYVPMQGPSSIDPSQAQSQAAAANLPRGVPPLASRWNPTQTFGDFTDATLKAYYSNM